MTDAITKRIEELKNSHRHISNLRKMSFILGQVDGLEFAQEHSISKEEVKRVIERILEMPCYKKQRITMFKEGIEWTIEQIKQKLGIK